MKLEFSAGGIVFKKERGEIFILIGQHSGHYGWVFPKGLIGDKKHLKGEGKEETAIREVREEGGVDTKIIEELPEAVFWYNWKGEKRKKTVYYFIMEYVGGNIEDHDWEMQAVEWVPFDEVENRLTYESDKKVFRDARRRIVELAKER